MPGKEELPLFNKKKLQKRSKRWECLFSMFEKNSAKEADENHINDISLDMNDAIDSYQSLDPKFIVKKCIDRYTAVDILTFSDGNFEIDNFIKAAFKKRRKFLTDVLLHYNRLTPNIISEANKIEEGHDELWKCIVLNIVAENTSVFKFTNNKLAINVRRCLEQGITAAKLDEYVDYISFLMGICERA